MGCAPTTRPDVTPIVLRFIPHDPEVYLDLNDLYDEEPVFTWSFRTLRDLAAWRLALLTKEFPAGTEYALLTSQKRLPRLFRWTSFDTESVDVIRLVADGIRYDARFHWAEREQRFEQTRSVRALSPDPRRETVKTFTFPMVNNPLWKGHVGHVRVDVSGLPNQKFHLHEITGVKLRVNEERLRSAITRGWKVDIREETRSALVVPPGHKVERELTIPPDSELRFGYGFSKGILSPPVADLIRFRLSIKAASGESVVLFEDAIDSTLRGSVKPPWKDALIDLAPYAGQKAAIILETMPNSSWRVANGVPAWSNPEMIQHTPRVSPEEAERRGNGYRASPANVILISISGLRADHLSLYGYSRRTSPNVDVWAQGAGVAFDNAITQATSPLPSLVSILTGLDPLHHGVGDTGAPASLTTLAEALREAGYATVAVTAGGPLGPGSGLAQGFDSYHHWKRPDLYEMIVNMSKVYAWLERNADRPFFLFFQTFEVDPPFRARDPYATNFGTTIGRSPDSRVTLTTLKPADTDGFQYRARLDWPDGSSVHGEALSTAQRTSLENLYDSGIAYADESFGDLIAKLRDLRLERDTLVVLTSDHGESLGEHGWLGHGNLSDETERVPIVFVFPRRIRQPRALHTQVRSVDIAPTIVDLLDLPPRSGIDGVSLVPLLQPNAESPSPAPWREAWTYAGPTNFGVSLRIANELKYAFNDAPWTPIRGTETLYRLRQDPGEEHNVAARAAEVRALGDRVRARLRKRPGLQIRLANAEKQPYGGSIRAPSLNQHRIKSPDLPCECVTWSGNRVRFEVPPGVTYTLQLDDPQDYPVSITATGPGTEAHEWTIEPGALIGSAALLFAGRRWNEAHEEATAGGHAPATGIRIWRQPVTGAPATRP